MLNTAQRRDIGIDQHRQIAERRMHDLQTVWCSFDVGPVISLNDKRAQLLSLLKPETRKNLEVIPVGLLHSHKYWQPAEIAAFEYSDGIRFIAIDFRFSIFLYGVDAFILAQLSAEEHGDDSARTFDSNARGMLSQFALLHLGFDDLQMPSVDSLPGSYPQAHHAWLSTQELFLVAHEFAHFILGHLGSSRLIPIEVEGREYTLPGGITLGFMTRSQEEELRADHQGAAMTINALLEDKNLTDFGREVCIAGLDVFFLILKMMDQIPSKDILMSDNVAQTTVGHPSGHARHASWREHFPSRLATQGGGMARLAERFIEHAISAYKEGRDATIAEKTQAAT